MLRLIISAVFVVLFLILSLPLQLAARIMEKKDPMRAQAFASAVIRWAFSCLWHLAGVRLTVKGWENIPAEGGALFAANHRSIFDIVVIYSLIRRPTAIISKDSMKKIPLLASWMRRMRCFFLDRSDLRSGMQMILDAISQVKEGSCVLIFPEGTRSRSEDELPLLEMHEGSFRISSKSGCPLIPVAISNTAAIFEKHSPFIHAAEVVVEFGSPILPETLSKEEKKHLGSITSERVTAMLKENHL